MMTAKSSRAEEFVQQARASMEASKAEIERDRYLVRKLGDLLQPRGWVSPYRPSGFPRVLGSFEWPPSRTSMGEDASAISIVNGRVEVFLADTPHLNPHHRVFDEVEDLDEGFLTQIEAYLCPSLPDFPEGFTVAAHRPRALPEPKAKS